MTRCPWGKISRQSYLSETIASSSKMRRAGTMEARACKAPSCSVLLGGCTSLHMMALPNAQLGLG